VGDFFNKAMMSDGYINLKNASNTTINGDIKVRGLIELSSGVVVNGNVVCDNMTNKGTINGNVVCSDRLENTGYISGDVWCKTLVNGGGEIGGKAECGSVVSEGDVGSGPFIEDPPPPVDMSKDWPEVGDLDGYYDDGLPILGIPVIKKVMDVTAPQSLGPGKTGNFAAGVRPPDGTAVGLVIDCPNQTDVVKLTGTVLVTGNLALKKGTLNLNGQAIYVRGVVTTNPPNFTVTGSGIIVALGDVYFAPNIEAGGVGDASVILHYNGTTWTTDTGGIDRNPDLSRAVLNDV
jgi:cytoskeletal protein CcmA (bactofilin family)